MEAFKLKVALGNAQIELEGNGELVHKIFQELRENGLGKLTISAESQSNSNSSNYNAKESFDQKAEGSEDSKDTLLDEELPTLENVVLQCTPKTEAEWLLIYATYCSNQGKSLFTKDDLRAKYDETNRITEARSKNFASNIKSLVSSKYISAVNANDFRLDKVGLAHAKSIIFDSDDEKKGKRKNLSNKKKSPDTYTMLELDLSREQRISFKDFWNNHTHSVNMDKAVLAAYWLNKEKNINEFTANHLFTMLRTIEEGASFDLAAAIRNARNNKNYFTDISNGAYRIHHIGEDHVKSLEIEGANK